MPSSLMMSLTDKLKSYAQTRGFDLVGVATAAAPESFAHLNEWIDAGFAGEMTYIERRRNAYEHPSGVMPTVKSVVMLGMNYHTVDPAMPLPGQGRVSRYAWGAGDYHDLLRSRLHQLADWLHEQSPGCRTRGIVDTAPLLERDFARLAGMGWFGKNTMLINKHIGSLFFLAGLLTDIELEPDTPHESAHCGTCTACLDACPTDAFPQPYVLDATRCISYLTIELRDQPIPEEHRTGIGDWLFGCDVCNDVCPWNRKAPISSESTFQPRADLTPLDAAQLLSLDDDAFNARFDNTPLDRPGRSGLLRNAAITLGNTGNETHVPTLERAANDDDPLIADAATWAINAIKHRSSVERHS